jgi:hypothetical protein
LRIDSTTDPADGAVFSTAVDRLQGHGQIVATFSVELRLKIMHLLQGRSSVGRVFFVEGKSLATASHPLNSLATMYTSRDSGREALGLRIETLPKLLRSSFT